MENDKAGATFKSENPNAKVDEMLATHKKMNYQIIKDKQWTKSSYNSSLEVHIQLIIFAFETKNKEAFESLLMSALINIKFRRYEVSYVSTIDILMSTSKDVNISNSFQKLPKDLNAANLRIELSKLKQGHKPKVEEKKEPVNIKDPKAKDSKAKDPKAKNPNDKVIRKLSQNLKMKMN